MAPYSDCSKQAYSTTSCSISSSPTSTPTTSQTSSPFSTPEHGHSETRAQPISTYTARQGYKKSSMASYKSSAPRPSNNQHTKLSSTKSPSSASRSAPIVSTSSACRPLATTACVLPGTANASPSPATPISTSRK